MTLPLNLVIDRTSEGNLRAEVVGHPALAVEAPDVSGLMNAVQYALLPYLDPGSCGTAVDDEELLRQAAVERMPERQVLKKLVERYPVPDAWPEGDEDWGDAT